MRRIFTLILGVMFVSGLFAQNNPEALIKKTEVKPVIDGVIDDVWATTDSNAILRPYYNDPATPTTPTLGEPGETWWKALWDEDGYYLIVNVADDNYFPNYVNGSGNPWDYDKPEIYFDVNFTKRDGLGPSSAGSGHYQFAPDMTKAKEDGLLTTETDGRQHAFKVANPAYVAEYFVPWTWLKDKEGIMVDKTSPIGFDVMINDNDPSVMARMRAIWGADNTQGTGEAWVNMDESGLITLDGAQPGVDVESITLTGGSITTDGGTLQIQAVVLPEDATVKTLTWTVATAEGSTGQATISSTGLLTAIKDGVVTVTAKAQDLSFVETTVDVTISGQVLQLADVNVIKNGFFDLASDTGSPTNWGNWVDGATYGVAPVVVDGVAVLESTGAHATDNWHYQFNQNGLQALPNIPYILKFKAWAANDRKICVDFEDTSGNSYNRYGASTHPASNGGRSEWTWDITTEPTWYTFDVTFDQIKSNTDQKIQYMISQATGTVYLDSVMLISEADMALLPTAIAQNSMESFKVYPNPAVNKLHVDLSTANSTVAIYNSVGVKMEETVVTGTHHVFDVSRYTKGLYFVKANNSVVKFVK